MPRKAIITLADGDRSVITAGEGPEWGRLVAEKQYAKRPALECRGCGAALTRVAGSVRPNHFRHLNTPDPGACRYANESAEHLRLKSLIVTIVNSIDGWVADDEVHGPGHRWIADVLAEQPTTGRGVAIEVQLASQAVHGDLGAADRTDRRTVDGYECVWFTKKAGVGHQNTAELQTLKDQSDGVKLHSYIEGCWVAQVVALEAFMSELLAEEILWSHDHSPVRTADALAEAEALSKAAAHLRRQKEQQDRGRRPLFAAAVQAVAAHYGSKAELLFRNPDGSLSSDPSFEIAEPPLGGGIGIWVHGKRTVDRVDGRRFFVESSQLVLVVGPVTSVEHNDDPRCVRFGGRVNVARLPALHGTGGTTRIGAES